MNQLALRALFDYDETTGFLTWRKNRGKNARKGMRAGRIRPDGYRVVHTHGKMHQAARLIWVLVNGRSPSQEIDHANGDRSDDRISNLREATRGQNAQNICTPRHNTTGFKGVSLYKPSGLYRATIKCCGRVKHLGYFLTPDQASMEYCAAACELHGKFSSLRNNVFDYVPRYNKRKSGDVA